MSGDPVSVTVFTATYAALATTLSNVASVLTRGERDRAATYATVELQERFEAGRAFLRVSLGDVLDVRPELIELTHECRWCGAGHGKPRLAAGAPTGSFSFNLSHARGRLVLAVCGEAEVGVDVESRWAVGPELERQIVGDHPGARAGRPADDEERRGWLTQVWTMKEAVLKCSGHGLAVDPRRVRHSDITATSGTATLARDEGDWAFGWRRLSIGSDTTATLAVTSWPIA